MKLRICALLICASLLLAACTPVSAPAPSGTQPPSGSPSPSSSASPSPSTGPDTAEPVYEPKRISLKVTFEEAEYRNSEDVLLLDCRLAMPSVVIDGDSLSSELINLKLSQKSAEFLVELDEHYGRAVSDYSTRPGSWTPYSLYRFISTGRVDSAAVSLVFTNSLYTGGAHYDSSASAVVLCPGTGAELSLSDLSPDPEGFTGFLAGALAQIAGGEEYEDKLFSDYEEQLPELIADGLWYLSDGGLTVICNPYIISPGSSGIVDLTVPYEKLEGVMYDAYLPRERPEAEYGSLVPEIISGELPGDFSSVSFVAADDSGQYMLLTAEGAVTDVRVYCENSWLGSFPSDRLLYACNRMAEGGALCIRTEVEYGTPLLRVSYRLPDGSVFDKLLSVESEGAPVSQTDVPEEGDAP